MGGTKAGGKAAAEINKKLYGPDFYKRIGAMGGRASKRSGFFANRELARRAGAKGGSVSRRKKPV
jgi:general stress protein YciG